MHIAYKPGKKHGNADAMSRMLNLMAFSRDVRDWHKGDPTTGRDATRVTMPNGRINVPPHLVDTVLWESHDSLVGAHLGFDKTFNKVQSRYFWPSMRKDVENYVKNCPVCQSRKPPFRLHKQPLRPIEVNGVFERMAMDVVGPLPLTNRGNKYILVIQEYLTKYPWAFPLPDQKAATVAKVLVEEVILQYGAPSILLTDLGSNFTSNLLREIADYWGIKRSFTTPYHPQCDGMVERFNRTLATMISTLLESTKRAWDDLIPYVLYAYRTAVHESTKDTPFYLMFGRDALTPTDAVLQELPSPLYADTEDFKLTMHDRLQKAWTTAVQNIAASQSKAITHYPSKPASFQVGDLVRVHIPYNGFGVAAKFHRPWQGPYRILKITGNNLLVKLIGSRKAPKLVHCDRCKWVAAGDQPNLDPRKATQQNDQGNQTNQSPADVATQEPMRSSELVQELSPDTDTAANGSSQPSLPALREDPGPTNQPLNSDHAPTASDSQTPPPRYPRRQRRPVIRFSPIGLLCFSLCMLPVLVSTDYISHVVGPSIRFLSIQEEYHRGQMVKQLYRTWGRFQNRTSLALYNATRFHYRALKVYFEVVSKIHQDNLKSSSPWHSSTPFELLDISQVFGTVGCRDLPDLNTLQWMSARADTCAKSTLTVLRPQIVHMLTYYSNQTQLGLHSLVEHDHTASPPTWLCVVCVILSVCLACSFTLILWLGKKFAHPPVAGVRCVSSPL